MGHNYFIIDILLSYNIVKVLFSLTPTVSGGLHANSYTSLSLQNPFIAHVLIYAPKESVIKLLLALTPNLIWVLILVGGLYAIQPVFRCLGVTNSNSTPRVPYAFANAYEVIFDTQTRYGAKLGIWRNG